MTYEPHLNCNIGVPAVYNDQPFRIVSVAQNYDIFDVELIQFINVHGGSKVATNNYLDAYSNVAFANIETDISSPMELNTFYYMYLLSGGKILAKLQGNIDQQPAPVVNNLTIQRENPTGAARVTGNVTNTIDFEYYVVLTQTDGQTQADLESIIESLLAIPGGGLIRNIDMTFTKPYESDQFPFLQYVKPYYVHVYAKNIHDMVSVTQKKLAIDITKGVKPGMGFTNILCDNMGNINTPGEIALNITFTASHTTLEYYALAFSSDDGTDFDNYTNHDIYTSVHKVTGNTLENNSQFTMTTDHRGDAFVIDTYVRVAILVVDEDTRQFSGTANVIDMNISLPVIEAFSGYPVYDGYTVSDVVVDPSLVFDINFKNNSMVPEIGEGVFVGYSVPSDGYVSIPGNSYIYLRDGMPEYLKSIDDQTWHISFRSESTSSFKMFLQNTRVSDDFQTSVREATGFYLIITNTFIQTIFFYGKRLELVKTQNSTGGVDLSVGVHSLTVTYIRGTHTIGLYFDGALLSTASAHPDVAHNVISWETAESIYVNRYYNLMPANTTDYHKISVFNRALGSDEVLLLHNESG